MNLAPVFYIFVVGIIITAITVYIMKHKKRFPYTHEAKKKMPLSNLDGMLSNIKFEVPQHKNTASEVILEKENHAEVRIRNEHKDENHTNKTEHKTEEKKKTGTHTQFDAKSAIIYSSLIQRKKYDQ